jgi:hypothetical protein
MQKVDVRGVIGASGGISAGGILEVIRMSDIIDWKPASLGSKQGTRNIRSTIDHAVKIGIRVEAIRIVTPAGAPPARVANFLPLQTQNVNPRNTSCIPANKIFAFIELEKNRLNCGRAQANPLRGSLA